MPEALTPQQASVKADSTVIVDPSTDGVLPCQPDGDGGTLCGIPVGYTGIYNRTGVYYLPKVRLILLFDKQGGSESLGSVLMAGDCRDSSRRRDFALRRAAKERRASHKPDRAVTIIHKHARHLQLLQRPSSCALPRGLDSAGFPKSHILHCTMMVALFLRCRHTGRGRFRS